MSVRTAPPFLQNHFFPFTTMRNYSVSILILLFQIGIFVSVSTAQSPMPLPNTKVEQPKRAFDNQTVYGPSPQAFEKAGDKSFENKDFYSAMRYYGNVLLAEENNVAVIFKYAESARQFGAFESAGDAYRNVASLDAEKKFPAAIFWLAAVEKMQGKYDPAYQHFKQFVAMTNADAKMLEEAKTELDECIWAMEQFSNPDAGVILNRILDNKINTAESEFGAVQRGDTMFYSSFRVIDWKDISSKTRPVRPVIKIMESMDGREPAISPMNLPDRHTAHTAFSPDGEWMIFNQCDYVGEVKINCELFLSKKFEKEWLTGVRLPDIINFKDSTTTQPNFGLAPGETDGSLVLYFVSNRPGGKGGMDIWKSKMTADGLFSVPENLTEINTPEDDITPFFDSRTHILYFSTTGRRSLGGFDIYKSALNAGKFDSVQHLDVPFNSSYNDIYFAMQGDDWAYFSSNRQGATPITEDACCYDIYKAEYLALKMEALSFSKITRDPLSEVVFTVTEKTSTNPPFSQYSGDTNRAEFEAKRDKIYQVIASKEGYRADTVLVTTSELPLDRKFVAKLYLEPTDFALNVRTFNQFHKNPLPGVSIRLIEMKDKVPVKEKDEKNTGTGNETDLAVRLESQYMIIGTKDKFFPDTVMVVAGELKPGVKLTKNLFLTPSSLNNFLPVALYFDNDQPDRNTRKETTLQAYDQTYHSYVARKGTFISTFTAGLSAEKKADATARLDNFFNDDVTGGYLKLDNFAENLGLFMENGYRVEIMVKGFASPLSSPAYNLALTKRRIASVLNYFRKAKGGIFNPYLISGQLAVTNVPFGETLAPPNVPDNPRDRRLSIYSVDASKERRAEILEIRLVREFKN